MSILAFHTALHVERLRITLLALPVNKWLYLYYIVSFTSPSRDFGDIVRTEFRPWDVPQGSLTLRILQHLAWHLQQHPFIKFFWGKGRLHIGLVTSQRFKNHATCTWKCDPFIGPCLTELTRPARSMFEGMVQLHVYEISSLVVLQTLSSVSLPLHPGRTTLPAIESTWWNALHVHNAEFVIEHGGTCWTWQRPFLVGRVSMSEPQIWGRPNRRSSTLVCAAEWSFSLPGF